MTVYNFPSVKVRAARNGPCPSCGKATTRRRIFESWLSPFNINEDGTERTGPEARELLKIEADAWVPDFRHNTEKCSA